VQVADTGVTAHAGQCTCTAVHGLDIGAEPDFLAGADAGYFILLVQEEPRDGAYGMRHVTLTRDEGP
jgi:hypothetical protein